MTHEDDFDSLPDQDEEWVSKTRRKKEMQALQDLGKKLVALNREQLAKVPLEPELLVAINECQRLKKGEAIRRQLQYIGRLMRLADAEAISQAMDLFEAGKQAHDAHFHKLERWRERLIGGSNDDLTAFVEAYPNADIQHLRQLVRNAQKEAEQQKPPASARKLFRYIRELAEN
ncbi:ribosome biogenesis factor YjgA [Marinobacterium aestuariivivens]|uniref:Dual-action ribosomal maturation protein DarP n=1 Tax=Marinobacterium aestuariivivens TaxID=1698799 RepID=A0ABW1ZWD3_9GAMM